MAETRRQRVIRDHWQRVALPPEIRTEGMEPRHMRRRIGYEEILPAGEQIGLVLVEPPVTLERRADELDAHAARRERRHYRRADTLPTN